MDNPILEDKDIQNIKEALRMQAIKMDQCANELKFPASVRMAMKDQAKSFRVTLERISFEMRPYSPLKRVI